MNPVEFLDVADRFQASTSEAERRTSIGRSYYALYNILLGFLSSQGVSFENGVRDHRRLVYYLTKCGYRQGARIGETLRDLRIIRNDADYHMNVTIDARQSQLAYQRARTMIDRFNALPPTDLHTIVQRIKALPPPPLSRYS